MGGILQWVHCLYATKRVVLHALQSSCVASLCHDYTHPPLIDNSTAQTIYIVKKKCLPRIKLVLFLNRLHVSSWQRSTLCLSIGVLFCHGQAYCGAWFRPNREWHGVIELSHCHNGLAISIEGLSLTGELLSTILKTDICIYLFM